MRGLPRFFFSNGPATAEIYALSLHDALPILSQCAVATQAAAPTVCTALRAAQGQLDAAIDAAKVQLLQATSPARSEEHTSELQSQFHLVCRLLLEKKKQFLARAGTNRPLPRV